MRYRRRLIVAIVFVLASPIVALPAHADDREIVFEDDVAPLLRLYCWSCHGGGGKSADLDLRTQPLILAGGKSGAVMTPGDPDGSPLYKKLVDGQMPPKESVFENVVYTPLKPTAEHIDIIREWIRSGAKARYTERGLNEDEQPTLTKEDRAFWAYVPPKRPALPVLHADRSHYARTAIDVFLLSAMADASSELTFQKAADRRQMLTRLTLDLTGLPPTFDEVAAFETDPHPLAYEQVVDRLLNSPAFGQRWGRRWLDATGYADTIAKDNDATIINVSPGKWRYRDYVVDSMNENVAFDRFLREQLAGDEMFDWRSATVYTPEQHRLLIATGFLRQVSDPTASREGNTSDIRVQVLQDTVQMVSTNLMGTTLHCARCHSHKFDPVSQADYFRVSAVFAPALNVQDWLQPPQRQLYTVPPQTKTAIDAENERLGGEIKTFQEEIAKIRVAVRAQLSAKKLAVIPEAIRADTQAALAAPAAKRSAVQKYLAERLGAVVAVSDAEISAALSEDQATRVQELQTKVADRQSQLRTYEPIQALWDVGPPPNTHLARRGDIDHPGPSVPAGVVAVFDQTAAGEGLFSQPNHAAPTSRYRTRFADWVTSTKHPLTARVFVNRIWSRYFGTGIVPTVDNFGLSGQPPSHPELLDWLATEFIRTGWDIKKLHRQIVTSAVYRQSSVEPNASYIGWQVDPSNRLLWRMPLRRLESEIVRDRMLAASGHLDARLGGPAVPVTSNADGSVTIAKAQLKSPSDRDRRSLYILARRNYHLTQLQVFDQPVMPLNCVNRTASSVVTQSLNMMNAEFPIEQAARLADRLLAEDDSSQVAVVGRAFRLILSRNPSDDELAATGEFLSEQAVLYRGQERAKRAPIENLCHMLLNTNEFLYIP